MQGASKSNGSLRKAWLLYQLRFQRFVFSLPGAIVTVLTFFLFVRCLLRWGHGKVHISSFKDQPLVQIFPSYMPASVFQSLQATLPKHPWITGNELDEDNFKHTRGWVVKFNLAGYERLKSMPEMKEAVKYFDAVRKPASNAFVMNLLIADQPPKGKDAVGPHQDDSAAIDHNDDFLAHQVNVLYIRVPKAMSGGAVEVWPQHYEDSEFEKAIVHSAENLMVEFKGTAFHRVRGFHSPSKGSRMSLVVEQYRIPEKYYKHTTEFCLNKECNEDEDEDKET